MTDHPSLERLARQHAHDARQSGQGAFIAFTSPRTSQSGPALHSELARQFALLQTAETDKPIWLLDADFKNNTQFAALAADGLQGTFDASVRKNPFWKVVGQGAPSRAGGLVTLHRHASGLLVSRAHLHKMHEDWRHGFCEAPDYWRTVRRFTHTIVMDLPASLLEGTGRTLFHAADSTIIVVRNDNKDMARARELRDEIGRAGGRCAGAILVDDGVQGLAA